MKCISRRWFWRTIGIVFVLGALCLPFSSVFGATPLSQPILEMPFLPGGSALAIAVSPAAPDELYSLLYHPDGNYLFHSANRGEVWSSVYQFPLVLPADTQSTLPYEYNTLVADPADADLLYVGSQKDLLRSQDGGVTWRSVLTTGTYIETPAPRLVYVVGPTGQRLANCGYRGWTFARSEDAGASWTFAQLPCTQRVSAVAVDPNDLNKIYLGLRTGDAQEPLLISEDGGATWQRIDVPQFMPLGLRGLAVDPTDSSRLYAVTWSAVLRSTDGGYRWRAIGAPAALRVSNFLNVVVTTAGEVLVTRLNTPLAAPMQTDLYRSLDQGASWWLSTLPLPARVNQLVLAPDDPQSFYAALLGKGIVKSTTLGGLWRRQNRGLLSQFNATRLATSQEGQALYVASATNSGGLLRTDNHGADWTPLIEERLVFDVALDPTGEIGLAATDHGLYERNAATDGQWQPASLPATVEQLRAVAISPVHPNGRLFSGLRRITEAPYYESVIGRWQAQGWELSWNRDYGVRQLIPHPTDANRWYGFVSASAIVVSEDGGQHWQLRLTGRYDPTDSPPTLQSMAVTERGLYLYGFATLLFSDNEGMTWTELPVPPSGLDPQQFNTNFTGSIFAGPDNRLLIANQDGVWLLTDGAEQWLSLGLRGATVLSLAVGGEDEPIVYASMGLRIVALRLPDTASTTRYLPHVSGLRNLGREG
ncbi:MAG: hypothetical protein R3C14_03270 [Caldilineaceae bacterium]